MYWITPIGRFKIIFPLSTFSRNPIVTRGIITGVGHFSIFYMWTPRANSASTPPPPPGYHFNLLSERIKGIRKHQDITLFLPAKNSSPALLQASSTMNREHRTVGTAVGKLGGNQTCLKPSRMSWPGWLHLVTTHSGLRSHTDHSKHLGALVYWGVTAPALGRWRHDCQEFKVIIT